MIEKLLWELGHELMTEGCQHNVTLLLEDEDYENLIIRNFGALKQFHKDKFTFYNMLGVDIEVKRIPTKDETIKEA